MSMIMKVSIKSNKVNKHILKNVESMIEFACKWYLPKYILKDIEVEVYISKMEDNCGDCSPIEEGADPRHFEINLSISELKEDVQEFYKTVMHECVHLKQYALNEMYDCKKSTVYKGKRFQDKNNSKRKPADYFFKPWEIEAYGSELGLLRQWEWDNSYSELE